MKVSRIQVSSFVQRFGAIVALGLVCLFATARYELFLTPENLINVLRQNSMVGLVALGMTLVIVSGGIDLSVGSLAALGGVIAADLSRVGTGVALLAAIGGTALLGLINGLTITKARIQPFVTTLAMMIAARGAALLWTADRSLRTSPSAAGLKWIGRGWVGPIPVPILICLAAYAIGWVVLSQTRFGRHMYANGDNEEAARLMGLPVSRVTVAVYVISGALSGLSGVLLASRLGAGQPVAGMGWELDAIAAVVVGGTLLAGGQGGAGSTVIGLLLLGVVYNLFNLEGTISSWWQWVFRGVFLLLVIVVQSRLVGRRA